MSPVRARIIAEDCTGKPREALLFLANEVENLRVRLAQSKRETRRARDELQDSRIEHVQALLALRRAKK